MQLKQKILLGCKWSSPLSVTAAAEKLSRPTMKTSRHQAPAATRRRPRNHPTGKPRRATAKERFALAASTPSHTTIQNFRRPCINFGWMTQPTCRCLIFNLTWLLISCPPNTAKNKKSRSPVLRPSPASSNLFCYDSLACTFRYQGVVIFFSASTCYMLQLCFWRLN